MLPSVDKLVKPESQDRNTFNTLKRLIKAMNELTDEQIAVLHFESWNEAYKRSGKETVND